MTRHLAWALALLSLAGCKREARQTRLDPPVAEALDQVRVMPNGISGRPAPVIAAMGEPYDGNAYQIAQGKRLYEWFNCQGCHADGGGASGPALMNGWWRYGPDPVSVFLSIRDGRPNGMPAFRDRLTTEQIWQLTGYVRMLGTTSISLAAPGRNDAMQSRPAENRAPAMLPPGPPPSR
ncbi:c-type cytochrome [Roseomonas marmotae]|uniref:C-type cytochrome n=1 Tax=Roseomonas marmotae TaxID=2768161 RepID=A0ABS3KDG8_9PROT|nr:c-type cytochrome [Roseomonas marmotae]MBO1075503.1 c-type cytochrome [Roseomonas marmotae]QTI81447.1 c-type cytochrome [Roseomonas marmotae]